MSLYIPLDANRQDDLWPNRGGLGLHPFPGLSSRPWRCSWGDFRAIICCCSWDIATEEWEQNSNEPQRHSAKILKDPLDPARPSFSGMPPANPNAAQASAINARLVVSQDSPDILPPRRNISFRTLTCPPTSKKNDVTPGMTSSAPSSSVTNDAVEPSLPGAVDGDGKVLRRAASSRSSSAAGSNAYESAMDKSVSNPYPLIPRRCDTPHAAGHHLSSQAPLVSDPQCAASASSPLSEPFPLFSPEASSMPCQSSQTSLDTRTATSVDSTSPENLTFQSPAGFRVSPEVVDSLVARAMAVDEPLNTQVSLRSKKHRSAELKRQFMNTLALKKSLLLRQMVTATDIGISLELLTQKVNAYTRDNATLTGALEQLKLIKKQNSDQRLDLPFYAFEHLRQPLPGCLLDIIDQSLEDGRPFFAKYEPSRDAALQFMNDPRALLENRLGKFPFMQR